MNSQTEVDDTAITVTVVEKEGAKLLPPRNESANYFWKTANSSPQAGDCTEPNNYLPLTSANSFFCPMSIVLGSTLQQNVSVLPDNVTLTVTVGRDRCIYDLQVAFTNPKQQQQQENDTTDALPPAAALLTVPRLPDVLLLEESHTCGDVSYQTRVEESTIAEAQYDAAAASNTQTATLSETAERVHHVQMDKVPAGEQATFRLRFLQVGGLKRRQAVLDTSHHQSTNMQRFIADLAIVPGYVGLDAPRAVPFELKVRLESGLKVEVPEKEVMYHDMSEVNKLDQVTTGMFGGQPATKKSHLLSLVQLGPSLVERTTSASNTCSASTLSWLSWKSPTGLARGTLLKIRLVDEIPEVMTGTTSTSSNSSDSAQEIIKSVDTFERICHDPATGTRRDSTLVDIHVPLRLPPQHAFGVAKQHQVYIIVDTSGSTAMRKNSNKTFLETCKVIMDRIFQALPAQIKALNENGALSGGPINFHLWSFDSDARAEVQNYQLGAGGDTTLQPLQFKIQGLKSGGFTNYDAWSKQLQTDVTRNPTDLHSVLLVTDGGATHRENLLRSVEESLSTAATSTGFFQVDCLGYGPWLDPSCVTLLANKTGGEALMVDTLEEAADSTGKWVTGILARSLLRASSRLTLKISGGDLLAVTNIENNKQQQPPSSKYNCAPFSSPHTTVDLTAGQKIRMILLHDSSSKPMMSLEREGAELMKLTWTSKSSPLEAQNTTVSAASADDESWPNKKLSDPVTKQTLRHLALLEPAFGDGVGYPAFSAENRKMVTLATSKRGQVVAPSVTKGIAVASLSFSQDPVPENCRPKPTQSLWSVDDTIQNAEAPSVKFQDDAAAAPTMFASFGSQPQAHFFGSPTAGGFGIATSTSTSSPFGTAPAPSPGAFASAFGCSNSGSTPFVGSPVPAPRFFQSQASPKQQVMDAGPPSIAAWVRETRGGLFPDEQKRMHLQAVSTRLTGSSLNSKLRDVLKDDNPLVGVVPGAITPPSTLIPSNLDVKQALHLIECTVRLHPGSTAGPTGSFEKWIEINQFGEDKCSDLRPVWPSLRFAARLCGVQESKPGDTDAWPWAGGIQGYSTAGVTPQEIAIRRREQDLFTPSVRRDIYRVLRNPHSPQKGATVSSRMTSPIFPGASLLAKALGKEDADGWDTFVFCHRADIAAVESNGYSALDDAIMLDAVANIGNSENPMAVAVTLAFEAFLEKLVEKHWGDEEASCLSVGFLIAFGREMTSRLDVLHRIRSTRLSAEELALLRSPRLSGYVNERTLQLFQGQL